MAQHNNEYAKAWTDSETLARALHGHEELSPSDQLALLVAQSADRLPLPGRGDRKSTRLNSSHLVISYAVFCLKKKKKNTYEEYIRTKEQKTSIARVWSGSVNT